LGESPIVIGDFFPFIQGDIRLDQRAGDGAVAWGSLALEKD
jgi:hypothetical protein